MERISITGVIKNFPTIIRKICNTRTPMLITHKNKPSAVILSMEDYYALEAMVYFLDSPCHAAQLMQKYVEKRSVPLWKSNEWE